MQVAFLTFVAISSSLSYYIGRRVGIVGTLDYLVSEGLIEYVEEEGGS